MNIPDIAQSIADLAAQHGDIDRLEKGSLEDKIIHAYLGFEWPIGWPMKAFSWKVENPLRGYLSEGDRDTAHDMATWVMLMVAADLGWRDYGPLTQCDMHDDETH